MQRVIGSLLLLVLLVIGLSFSFLNAHSVTLQYYFGAQSAPLSFVIVAALIFGAILGVLASLGVILRQRREIARLRREVRVHEQEVANLRNIPLKDVR